MFWKWLSENHPIMNFLIWLAVTLMSLSAIGISIYCILVR